MGISKVVDQKNTEAKMREAARQNLVRNSKDYRQERLVEAWLRVPGIKEGFQDLTLVEQKNLALMLDKEAAHLQKLTESQMSAAFNSFTPENMLRLVRLSMPNVIRSKVFTEFTMESAKDSIKYVQPVWAKSWSGKDLNDRHEQSGYDDDPWKYDSTIEFDNKNRQPAIYETTQEQATNWAILKPDADGVVEFKGKQFGANGEKYVGGYLYIFANGKENRVFAQQSKETGAILVNTVDFPGATVVKNAENKYTIDMGESGIAVTELSCKGFFNNEDDFVGDYLGEVELKMKSQDFIPRATTVGVSWSNVAEMLADASFSLSIEETLLGSAAQAVRVALDHKAMRIAYASSKTNPASYRVRFNAAYSNPSKDGYWQNAQTFIGAVHQMGDTIYDDIKRGGVSRMVGGPAAISYMAMMNYYKPTGKAKAAEGCHQFGELDGIPIFKVPSEIIPTNEILTVWKNEQNEGDIGIVFATLIPFFATGTIQRKNFYKEAGIMTLGDYAIINSKYLGLICIDNLKQGAGIEGTYGVLPLANDTNTSTPDPNPDTGEGA